MTRQKKLFAVLAVIFALLLIYVSYDISRRTTFPGSKPQLKERPLPETSPNDTPVRDSIDSVGANREKPVFDKN